MKIYNEVITRFNDLTGKWETISEDSYEYSGPVALAQGVPPNSLPVATADTIADTIKTTTGYFTNGDGTLDGSEIFTGSLSATNEKYYFNVNQLVDDGTAPNSETQFSITFAHIAGSGSDQYGDTTNNNATLRGETQVIYKQLSQLLLDPLEVTGGFKIASQGSYIGDAAKIGGSEGHHMRYSTVADSVDQYLYVLVGKRAKFKDRMNKKAWTLNLSGSFHTGSGCSLTLTDDSKYVPGVATPAGPRYNIVSGALGEPSGALTSDKEIAYKDQTYGWFYPERGMMVFSGVQMSASMPGGMALDVNDIITSNAALTNLTASDGLSTISGSTTAGTGLTDITGSLISNWGAVPLHVSHSANHADSDHPLGTDTGYPSSSLYLLWTTGSAESAATYEQYMGICHVLAISSKNQVISCSNGIALGQQPAPYDADGSGGSLEWDNSPGVSVYIMKDTTYFTASFDTHSMSTTPDPNDGAAGIGVNMVAATAVAITSSLTGSRRNMTNGFAPALHAGSNARNALRFANCMRNVDGMALRLRSEEDATQENYFCRIGANDFNFTSNPTFVSGSKNKMSNTDMFGGPTTFITGIGLYNSSGQLLAVAELSKPLKKTFASEATIKVKLTY